MNVLQLPFTCTTDLRGIGNQPVEGVQDAAGLVIANCGTHGDAYAKRIVRDCNTHEPLINALKELLQQTVNMDIKNGIALSQGKTEAWAQAMAVLVKAQVKIV